MLVLSGTYKVTSTGAPIGSTGGPGETTCARSGCHTGDNNLNSGTGRLAIRAEGLNGSYVPGKTYPLTVILEQENINRFGFSLVALDTAGKSSGTIKMEDDARMQVLKGSGRYNGRDYATYRLAGTAPYAPGKGQWSFSWTAPVNDEGPVTLYVAAVSANNDGTDKGDEVYTDSLQAMGVATGLNRSGTDGIKVSVYPNPVKGAFVLSLISPAEGYTEIVLTDLQGNKVCGLWQGNLGKGLRKLPLQLASSVAKGFYLVCIRQASGSFTHKILVEL